MTQSFSTSQGGDKAEARWIGKLQELSNYLIIWFLKMIEQDLETKVK